MYEITIPETLLVQSDEGLILRPETASELAELKRMVEFLKEQEEELKKAILMEMEANGIRQLKCDELTITYIEPGERTVFRTKAFEADHPQLYDKYSEMTKVNSHIKVQKND